MMREIVDKHFPDNWIISYYIGFTADLSVLWAPYKAAFQALQDTINPTRVQSLVKNYVERYPTALKQLKFYLTEVSSVA